MENWRKLANDSWRHPWSLIWIALAYLPFLGRMSVPLTGDQKVYLSTSLEMWERQSWLLPVLFGETSYYKPPMQYWSTILGWELFGLNWFGALIPSVVLVLATSWLLGEIASRFDWGKRFTYAGVWFAAALGTVTYGTTAQMEIYLVFFYTLSWWAGLKYLDPPFEKRKAGWLFLAFAVAGLAAMVKSPLYSAFWVVGYVSYLLISGEWEVFRQRRIYAAWIVGIAIGASWYLLAYLLDYDRFWAGYVQRETVGKNGGNGGSVLSLWGALLYFCFPFTVFVFPSIRSLCRRRSRRTDLLRLAIAWSWLPALFFSLYPYRIKPYLYLLLPMVVLVVDWALVHYGRRFRVSFPLTGVLALLVFGLVGVVLFRAGMVPLWIFLAFFGVGLGAVYFGFRRNFQMLAVLGLSAVFIFRGAATSIGEMDLAGLRDIRSAHISQPFGMVDEHHNIWHEIGMLSTAIGHSMHRVHSPEGAAEFVQSGGVLLLNEGQHQWIDQMSQYLSVEERASIQTESWKRWRRRVKFPFKEVLLRGQSAFLNKAYREFKAVSLKN